MSVFINKVVSILLVVCVLVLFVGCAIAGPNEPQLITLEEIIASHEGMSFHSGDENMIHYYHYDILKVSDRPLFSSNGQVNQDVLNNLLAILDNPQLDPMLREPKTEWPTGLEFVHQPYTAITAEDFSRFVIGTPETRSHSGAVVIKLFETIPERVGVENYHLTEFTSQWWQLVYRASDDGQDVLTLWMMQPYRLTHFNGTRYGETLGEINELTTMRPGDGPPNTLVLTRIEPGENTIRSDLDIVNNRHPSQNYFLEGNYSTSMARSNLMRDLEGLLNQFDVEQYIVAPAHIPGNWQSSRYQTGTNIGMVYYVSGQFQRGFRHPFFDGNPDPGSENPYDGLGAAGRVWGWHWSFNLMNGKDGLSIGPRDGQWPNTTISPTNYDLLWLPSDFEIRTMGHSKDDVQLTTLVMDVGNPASKLCWNHDRVTSMEDLIDRRTIGASGRSGLWRLNGFNRAFDYSLLGLPRSWETQLVWVRSSDTLRLGNANALHDSGNRYSNGVAQLAGMRPALHLSVSQLRENHVERNRSFAFRFMAAAWS